MSSVKKAYAVIDGRPVNAVYDEVTELWTVEMTAPATSSWTQPDHVYLVELHAEDQAGNVATMTASDETYGDQLKIRVLETTKPTATILYPTAMSILGSNTVEAQLKLSDEGESGINISSVVFKLNGDDKSYLLEWERDQEEDADTKDVWVATYTIEQLNDGMNSLSLSVSDNDGNESDDSTVTFVVSTKAPTLEITSPMEGVITNGSVISIVGSTAADIQGVGISSVTVNDVPITVEDDGTFEYEYVLSEGENTITIIATDAAGNSSQVVRHVTLDTDAPIITDVTTESVVVDASGMIKITFKVVDAST